MQMPGRTLTFIAITTLFSGSTIGCKGGPAPGAHPAPSAEPAPNANPTSDPALEAQKDAAARKEVILTMRGDGRDMELTVKPGVEVTREEFFNRYRFLLRMGPDDSITEIQPVPPGSSRPATTHYTQRYKGVPLWENHWVTREVGGFVAYAEGRFVRGLDLDVTPVISEKEAQEKAIAAAGAKESGASFPTWDKGKLGVRTSDPGQKPGTYHITYLFVIHTSNPVASYLVEVDAKTGKATSSPAGKQPGPG